MIINRNLVVIVLFFLCMVVSSSVLSECPVQIMGKYDIAILQQQWDLCQSDECDGCLFENYPDNFPDHENPFDNENGNNCNGMRPNDYGLWSSHKYTLNLSQQDPGYKTFSICGTVEMLNALLTSCNQHKGVDILCYAFDGESWIDVPGAYLVGSAIILDEDVETHIHFGELGYPLFIHEGDWGTLRDHIQAAINGGAAGWLAVYLGAISYMNDAHEYGVIAAKLTGEKTIGVYDYEWGEKVMAHALHAWQCWEGGQYEFDLWSEVGMSCIPFVVDETPSFFYSIAWTYDDLLGLPVNAEPKTWGGLKSLYR